MNPESSQLPPQNNAVMGQQVSALVARGELFEQLNQSLQLNQYALPDYFFRADLIPLDIGSYDAKDKMQFLDGASTQITMDKGYPAQDRGGTPFWEQLPAEPADAYNAYMVWLELPEKSSHDNPVRMLPMIAEITQIPIEDITAYYNIFYWQYRSRAYDLFIIACHRKQREARIMTIEGHHFKMADELLRKVQVFANAKIDAAISEPDSDDTKLKDLVDMASKLVDIQRKSVGLSVNGNQQIDVNMPRHASAENIMSAVAKESQNTTQQLMRPAEMDALLASPDDLSAIQDLIVRMNTSKVRGDDRNVDGMRDEQRLAEEADDDVEDLGNPEI